MPLASMGAVDSCQTGLGLPACRKMRGGISLICIFAQTRCAGALSNWMSTCNHPSAELGRDEGGRGVDGRDAERTTCMWHRGCGSIVQYDSTHRQEGMQPLILQVCPPTWVMEGDGSGQHYFGALDTRVEAVVHAAIAAEWSCRETVKIRCHTVELCSASACIDALKRINVCGQQRACLLAGGCQQRWSSTRRRRLSRRSGKEGIHPAEKGSSPRDRSPASSEGQRSKRWQRDKDECMHRAVHSTAGDSPTMWQ